MRPYIVSYCCFSFWVEATKIFPISFASWSKGLNFLGSTTPESMRISNQYCVSLASLRAISILLKKSLSDCADLDSRTFAPIDVPERKSCLDSVLQTPGSWYRKEQAFTILIANCLVLSVIGITPLILPPSVIVSIVHSTTYDLRLTTYDLRRLRRRRWRKYLQKLSKSYAIALALA